MEVTYEMIYQSLGMFAFLAVELTALFLLISYVVGVLQEYIPPAKIQAILSGKGGRGTTMPRIASASRVEQKSPSQRKARKSKTGTLPLMQSASRASKSR